MKNQKLIFNLSVAELEQLIAKVIDNRIQQFPARNKKDGFRDNILLTMKEVTVIFKITKPTAYKWMKCGVLPKPKKIGGRVYFYKSEILKIIENDRTRM